MSSPLQALTTISAHEVILNGEVYSASSRPSPQSRLVERERTELLTHLDLPILVSSISNLSTSLDSAYHGLSSFPDLQAQIATSSITITRLADRTASTIYSFATQADRVLEDLQVVHGLLIDNMEPVACQVLKDAGTAGGGFAEEAGKLSSGFEDAANKITDMLEDLHERQKQHIDKRKELESQMEEAKVSIRKANLGMESLEQARDECDALITSAESREWVASLKCNALHLAQILSATGAILHSRLHMLTLSSATALVGTLENERMCAREEKAVHLHRKQRFRAEKLDLQKDIAQLQSNLEATKARDFVCLNTINALQESVSTLRTISSTMMKVESFMSQVNAHCSRLCSKNLLSMVESSLSMTKEERSALWVSQSFKVRAVRFCARWAALHNVCTEYNNLIRHAHQGMYRMLENG